MYVCIYIYMNIIIIIRGGPPGKQAMKRNILMRATAGHKTNQSSTEQSRAEQSSSVYIYIYKRNI